MKPKIKIPPPGRYELVSCRIALGACLLSVVLLLIQHNWTASVWAMLSGYYSIVILTTVKERRQLHDELRKILSRKRKEAK